MLLPYNEKNVYFFIGCNTKNPAGDGAVSARRQEKSSILHRHPRFQGFYIQLVEFFRDILLHDIDPIDVLFLYDP